MTRAHRHVPLPDLWIRNSEAAFRGGFVCLQGCVATAAGRRSSRSSTPRSTRGRWASHAAGG